MRDMSVPVARTVDFITMASVVEGSCDHLGLRQTMKATLRTYPGSVHWHYKWPGLSGTLEVTAWPEERRLWITVQDGRRARWIDEALPALTREMKRRLGARRLAKKVRSLR